jgi:hypothetical protein
MILSKKYIIEQKYCPTKIEWDVSNSPLIISTYDLYNYYNFYNNYDTGFAFILKNVLDNVKK